MDRSVTVRFDFGSGPLEAELILRPEDEDGSVAYLRLPLEDGGHVQCAIRTREQAIGLVQAASQVLEHFVRMDSAALAR